jgi:type IV pilus assembly protein PilB
MLADVSRYSVREILIERGILSEGEIAEIEKFKNETGWSFAKICLTLGFVSRKKWAELFKELGYEIIDIKKEKVDVKTLSYLNMLVMEQYLGVPLRKENGEVIVAMCDPTDAEFIEMVKKIFKMEVKVIFAIDVDIVWVLHKYLGPPFCRIAIYNLLWNDPDRSAVLTFTPRQIAVILALITAYLLTQLKQLYLST